MALRKWNDIRRNHGPDGEARIKRMKDEITSGALPPLDPKHRPAGPCQECMYRKEHHGVCSNCGRPSPKGKRIL